MTEVKSPNHHHEHENFTDSQGAIIEITPENISLLEDDINIVVFFPNKKPSHLTYLADIQTHLNKILAKRKTYYETLSDITSLEQNSTQDKQNELSNLVSPLASYFRGVDSDSKIKICYCLTSYLTKTQTNVAIVSNLLRKFVFGRDFSTRINYQSALSKFFDEEDEVRMPFKDNEKDPSSSMGMGDNSEEVSFDRFCCCAISIKNKLKFVCEQFNDEMHTLDTVFQFGLELIEGEKKQFVKSERIPSTPDTKKDPIYSVHKTVSKNYEEMIFGSKKNVFLFVWTDWCPPCAMVFPQFYKMSYALAEEKDFMFTTFDSDKNDRIEDFCIPESDLPLLKFFCSEKPKQKNVHYLKNLNFKTLLDFFCENAVCPTEPINRERVLKRYQEAEKLMNKKMIQLPLFGVPFVTLNQNNDEELRIGRGEGSTKETIQEDIDQFLQRISLNENSFDYDSWLDENERLLSKEVEKQLLSSTSEGNLQTKAVVVCFLAFFAPTSKRMEVFLANLSEKLSPLGVKFIKILLDDFLRLKKLKKQEKKQENPANNPFFINVSEMDDFPTFKIFSFSSLETIVCDTTVGALPGLLGTKLKRIVESE